MEEKTIDELLNEEIADEIKALSELEAGSKSLEGHYDTFYKSTHPESFRNE